MTRLTGKHIMMRMLIAEGVEYVFGNPGTSELPFMDAVQDYPRLTYMLALQEATAMGMADGYARASGKVGFVNLHIAAGLANGVQGVYNAWRGGTPLVVTAGQSDTRMLLEEPTLSGNLVEMVAQYTKWSAQVSHAAEIPMAFRRAFKLAMTPPTGPVFLALPWNALEEEADVEIVPSNASYFRIRPDARALEEAAALLAEAERPLILVGDRVAQSGGVKEAVALAELIGARVSGAGSEVVFPTGHPQFLPGVNVGTEEGREALRQADVVLAIGTNLFSQFLYNPDGRMPSGPKVVHLDPAERELEKIVPVDVGLWADVKAGLEDLTDAVDRRMSGEAREAAKSRSTALGEKKHAAQARFQQQADARWDQAPIAVERMMVELRDALPDNAVVAAEAITSGVALNGAMEFNAEGDYFGMRGGGLGWAMGGSLGVRLARPERPVAAVVGDGAAMYSIQALWTAARYDIPVVYVFCNNRSYRILKQGMRNYLGDSSRDSDFTGMDFHELPLDFAQMAKAFGIQGERVERPEDLGPALRRAFASGKPAVVDVVIDGALPAV